MGENKLLNIPISKTNLSEDEILSVLQPLRSGWLVQGAQVRSFEEKWKLFTKTQHSIAVTSCTSGLHLSVVALGLKPGDEVIVPAFTWISTANVIEHQGAKPVFCDIKLDTFNIDVTKIEALITDNTVGIIPVHLFGLSSDMPKIMEIAAQYGLWVVEDAACGFGARLNGKHVGSFGDTGVFSFHPRKAITTGEGGMVTSNSEALGEKIQQLRDHGAVISDLQRHLGPQPYLLADHIHAGYNQRMTDIQGALGNAQMERANAIIEERQSIAAKYNSAFKSLYQLEIPTTPKGFEHGFQSYACLYSGGIQIEASNIKKLNNSRNILMAKLQEKGVSTRPGTHAVHMLSYYKKKYNLKSEDYINSWIANDCSISLPLFNGMSDEQINYVIDIVTDNVTFENN